MNIKRDHLKIEVFDGLPRTKKQILTTAGGMCGDALQESNKSKVRKFYSFMKFLWLSTTQALLNNMIAVLEH